MRLGITSDTEEIKNAKVSELGDELMYTLEDRISSKYAHVDITMGVVFRCLRRFIKRKTFFRFTKKDRYLVIDITVTVEDYEEMSIEEQRQHLGNAFLDVIDAALSRHKFEGIDKEEFKNDIKIFANLPPLRIDPDVPKPGKWFQDEIDWSKDLDE
jgi:hypothetical protein